MSLIATRAAGWSTGFGNLLGKELDSWWRTRRWVVHLVLWLGVIAGFILLISLESRHDTTPARGLDEVMNVFFQAGGFFALIGAVLVTQGSIVGERSYGTAAWVLTKPTTRKAFVLSKFVGITGTFLLLSLVIPAFATLIISRIVWGLVPGLDHFAEAVGILALHQTFYIALTLMLGTFFQSRGPVGGLALGFWVSGNILPNFVPPWLTAGTPWSLARSAGQIALWQPVGLPLWIPVAISAVLIVVMLLAALWRFEREEF